MKQKKLLSALGTEMLQLFFAIKTGLMLAGHWMERTFLFLGNATHDGVTQNGRVMNSKYLQWTLARISSILSLMNVQYCKIRISISAHNCHPSTLREIIWSLEISYLWHDWSSSQAAVSHGYTVMPQDYQNSGKAGGCEQAAENRIFCLLNVGSTVVWS